MPSNSPWSWFEKSQTNTNYPNDLFSENPQLPIMSTALSQSTQDRACEILTEETPPICLIDSAEVVDMSQKIESIRASYWEAYHRSKEVLAELQSVWWFQTNDCGVITEGTEKELLAEHGRVEILITLAESSKGYWLYGLSASTSVSWMGFAPSVYHTTAYHSRESAYWVAKSELIRWLERESRSVNSCDSQSNRDNVRLCLEDLKNPQTAKQLDLL